MSTRVRLRRRMTKLEIDLELAKLDLLCRQYEAGQWYRNVVTEETIRG